MKKILTILTASLILTTAGAEDLESFYKSNKNVVCLKINNYNSIIPKKNEDLCRINTLTTNYEKDTNNRVSYIATRDAIFQASEDVLTKQYGNLSVETLKNAGITSKTTMNWGNIVLAYEEFLCSLNEEERETISKFYTVSLGTNDLDKDLISHFLITHKMISYNFKFDSFNFASFFIRKNDVFTYDSASFREFLRAVLEHKYENAKTIARKVLEDSKFDTILYQAEKACKSYKTKDIASIHTRISEQLKNADFMK